MFRTTIGIVETIVETATVIPLVQEVKVNKDLAGEVLGTAVARDTVVPEGEGYTVVSESKESEGILASTVEETTAAD